MIKNYKIIFHMLVSVLFFLLFLISCSDEIKDEYNISEVQLSYIEGIAAANLPVSGNIYVKGVNGNIIQGKTNSSGFYKINVSSIKGPYLIWIDGILNEEHVIYYSYIEEPGYVNITPASNFVMAMALNMEPANYYLTNFNLPDINAFMNSKALLEFLLKEMYLSLQIPKTFDFMYDYFETTEAGFSNIFEYIDMYCEDLINLKIVENMTHNVIFDYNMEAKEIVTELTPEYINEITIEAQCSDDLQKKFIYDYMKDMYYWNDYVPDLDIELYFSPENLFEDLIYTNKDKWSYIDSKINYDNYHNDGTYFGYGFFFSKNVKNQFPIYFVYKNSDAGIAGLERSDLILEIDGEDILKLFNENMIESYLGNDQTSSSIELTIQKQDGTIKQVYLTKKWVKIDSILHYEILSYNNKKIAYLVYNSFHPNSVDELSNIFKYFTEQDVSELILDLRYNGGGSGAVAQYLASIIVGNIINNDVDIFYKQEFNQKYSKYNFDVGFISTENSLDLNRVFIITSNITCSASELIISGIRPYIDVFVVGGQTCGKPYGLIGEEFCDKVLVSIVVKVLNADNESYEDGIIPDCFASDNPLRSFGDIQEDSLMEVLYLMDNDKCSYSQSKKIPCKLEYENIIHFKGLMQEINAF